MEDKLGKVDYCQGMEDLELKIDEFFFHLVDDGRGRVSMYFE